ncbi:MAG: hypothetical protein ACRDA4_10475 [Filifactoraceae bacterium]
MSNIVKEITSKRADRIIVLRKERGLFYVVEDGVYGINTYIGIDNSDGDAWTEDFTNKEDCIKWLRGED